MTFFWGKEKLLLGAGRKMHEDPRVDAIDVASLEVTRCVTFERGHSTYVLARDGTTFVAGTRRGQLHVLRSDGDPSRSSIESTLVIERRVAQLAACLVPGPSLVAADVEGDCVWWPDLGNLDSFRLLKNGNANICALAHTENSVVTGLATNGEMIQWNLPDERPFACTSVPSPPREYALTWLARLRIPTQLAYAASSGRLVIFDTLSREVYCLQAHDGDFYALCVVDDRILTIGKNDSVLRAWQPGKDRPLSECQAPTGIIAMAPLPSSDESFLLVNYDGQAGIWIRESNRLHLVRQISGGDYRVVLGLTFEEFESVRADRKSAEMTSIVEELSSEPNSLSSAEMRSRHDRLVALGGELASLEILARQANERQTSQPEMFAEELRLRHRQASILPETEAAVDPLLQYAAILTRVWAPEEANHVYKRIRRISPDHPVLGQMGYLDKCIQAIHAGDAIIELDDLAPFEALTDSATVLRKPFSGRFVVGSMTAIQSQGIDLSLTCIADKYNQVVGETSEAGEQLSQSRGEQVQWLTRSRVSSRDILSFDGEPDPNQLRVSIVLPISRGATMLLPSVVLDVPRNPVCADVAHFNSLVCDAFLAIKDTRVADAWCRRVYGAIQTTINKLNNEALALHFD